MITPAQLTASLSAPRRITVQSDPKLIADLNRLQAARQQKGFLGGKPPKPVPAFAVPVVHLVAPAALLLCTGLATTPLVSLPVSLSSQWAYYRYMWAFDPASALLCLEASVKSIDFHQKAVLSDELGVGMAHWVMTELLGATSHIDVDVAVNAPSIARQQGFPVATLATKRSPDLLYQLGPARFGVVECKGSQSNRSQTLKQLVSGLEQVPSLRINNARLAEEYVVATTYALSGTNVYVVDPPGDDEDVEGAERDTGAPRPNELSASSVEALREDVDRLYAAKLLAFAGDTTRALGLANVDGDDERGQLQEGRPDGETTTVVDGPTGLTLIGQPLAFPVRGAVSGVRQVQVFQGVAADVFASLADDGAVPEEAPAGGLRDLFAGTDARYLVRANGADGEVTAVSRDGAALQIRLS